MARLGVIVAVVILCMVAAAEAAPKAKKVKCQDRNSNCFHVKLLCPDECLRTCVVDCASCQPVCKAPPPPPPASPPPPPKAKKPKSPPPPPPASPPPPPPKAKKPKSPPPPASPPPPPPKAKKPKSPPPPPPASPPPPPKAKQPKSPPPPTATTPELSSPPPPTNTPSPPPPVTATPSSPPPPSNTPPSPTPPVATPSPPPPPSNTPPSPTPPVATPSPPPPPSNTPSPTPPVATPSPPSNTPSPTPPVSTPSTPPPPSSESAGQSKVKCKKKEYPKCYDQEFTCPKSCPSQCEVDCETCKPVCPCNLPGAVCQDPRFIGGDGITFYFHGKKGHDFCLVSDSNLHINGHFIGKRNYNMSRDFTWVQSIGILFDTHELYIGAKRTSKWENSRDHLIISLDDTPIFLPDQEGSKWQSSSITITRTRDVNVVEVEVEGNFKIKAAVVPITQEDSRIHKYGVNEEDCFAHLDLSFKFYTMSGEVDGVLGQTYAQNYVSKAKMGVSMPVLGGEDKFSSSNIFATDCRVAKFYGGSKKSEVKQSFEYEDMKCGSGMDGLGVVCKR
ncbi:unnamed protein product [Rhodiola kirilowii]